MVPKKTKIVEGARAPSFRLQADNGDYISLSDFLGKTLILYFYPKDDTAGCTREAIEFTAATKLFAKAGAVIAGVSKDSPARHIKFKEKHQIDLMLLSDEDGKTVEAYGSWVEKSPYGRTYMGIDRSTFLISRSGRIEKIWRKVKVPGHVAEVLEAAKALKPKE